MTAHYPIIVCENAEENCPRFFPSVGERLFWPFETRRQWMEAKKSGWAPSDVRVTKSTRK